MRRIIWSYFCFVKVTLPVIGRIDKIGQEKARGWGILEREKTINPKLCGRETGNFDTLLSKGEVGIKRKFMISGTCKMIVIQSLRWE